jgi:ketosteroid isomerase-like protein
MSSHTSENSDVNVESIRRVFEAIEGRDRAAFLALLDPEFAIHWPPSLPYGGQPDRVASGQSSWLATWQPLQPTDAERTMSPRIVASHGPEVVVLWRQRGRSPAGETLDSEVLGLYEFRNARLLRAQMFHYDSAAVAAFLERASPSR